MRKINRGSIQGLVEINVISYVPGLGIENEGLFPTRLGK